LKKASIIFFSKVDDLREVSCLRKKRERKNSFVLRLVVQVRCYGSNLRHRQIDAALGEKYYHLRTAFAFFRKRSFFMNKTQKLTATAMLVALSVVANIFSVQIYGSNYISFTYIPCFVAAIWLGVIPAAAVGFLGDLIAGLLFPHGVYNILIGISSTLIAVVPAVIYKIMPNKRRIALLTSLAICSTLCTSGLNTYALWLMYGAQSGKTFWVYLGGRLPFQLLNTLVNGVLIALLQESRAIDNALSKIAEKREKDK